MDNHKKTKVPIWHYIFLPLIVVVLHLIVSLVFYFHLSDSIAYHFIGDGTPDRWMGKNALIGGALILQLAILVITTVILVAARRKALTDASGVLKDNSAKILYFIGSMPVFLQVVISFVIMDIFSYNVYQKHLFPLWLFVIIVLVLATVVFTVFFVFMAKSIIKQSE